MPNQRTRRSRKSRGYDVQRTVDIREWIMDGDGTERPLMSTHNVSPIKSVGDVQTNCIFVEGCTKRNWLMIGVSDIFCSCLMNKDERGMIRRNSCYCCRRAIDSCIKYKDNNAIVDFTDVAATREVFREFFQRPEVDRCSRWWASEEMKQYQRVAMAFYNVH